MGVHRPGPRRLRLATLVPSLVTMAVAAGLVPGALVIGLGVSPGSGTPAAASVTAHTYDDAGMIGFGAVDQAAPALPQPLNSPVFSGVATPNGGGYLLASADGGVFAFGNATFEGSAGSLPLQGPIVAMATTPDAKGYWLGALDGAVFAYGDATFYGSMGATHLNEPIVGVTGDTRREGLLARRLRRRHLLLRRRRLLREHGQPGAQRTHRRHGRDARREGLLARRRRRRDLTFGDANFYGSAGSANLPDAAVGMVASPDGGGYLIATENGVVLPYGDAQAFGGSPSTRRRRRSRR